jgi:hypothetical protein
VTDLALHLPAELIDAIADAVAAKLQAQPPQREEGDPWELWNVDEVCRRLGRSKRWVGERTRSGELPHIRLDGGAKAYNPHDVKTFARARRVPMDDPGQRLRAVGPG